MTEIELTDAQRQALQAERGTPLAVVDPATRQRYVLLALEQYERVRSLLEAEPAQRPPANGPPVGPPPGQADVERIRLRDLLAPPEVVAAAERWCKKYGFWRKKWRHQAEDQFKLQYYFARKEIYLIRTPDGPVVIPIPERYKNTPGLRYVLLTPEERSCACLDIPYPLDDDVGIVGGP